jgi:dolichyl-phosphate-mannose--protein O-mannosyl transferase
MRLIHLGFPPRLVFDETYYVKDAYSLLRFGYERQWGEGDVVNPQFVGGTPDVMSPEAAYVVHPPVGKWMIGLGEWIFGVNGFGWRFASALVGILSVFILIVTVRRMFRSHILGCLAGLLLAVDGEHLVHSRTALLDVFVMFWALLAFYLILVDRAQMRRRLDERLGAVVGYGPNGAPRYAERVWGPRLGMRWFLLAAGVSLGLCTGVKWSGAYFLAVFGLLVVCWDAADRRAVGIERWWQGAVLRDGIKAFGLMVPVAVVVYVGSWAGWLATSGGYNRDWATTTGYSGILPGPLAALLDYHRQAWGFHTGLTTPHTYQANPLGWLAQWRPTSFFYEKEATCATAECSQAITAAGNPILWWLGIAALLVVLYYAIFWADRRAWAILAGYAAGYLPWLIYLGRTVFTFYTVAFTPFVVMALIYMFGVLLGPPGAKPARRRRGTITVGVMVGLILLASAFWWPLWTGESIPYDYWHAHMWLPSWI